MNVLRSLTQASVLTVALTSAAHAEDMKAEVLHWWTSGGESAAIKVFADAFSEAGGEWIDTAIAGGENARNAGINRIIGGEPPTAMQFNTGKQFDELVSEGHAAGYGGRGFGRPVAGQPAGSHPRCDRA